jgi:uncharacterized phiE125 gp8 family phage protein
MSNEYQVRTITGPAGEPVSLAECKTDLRVDHDADNELITSLIKAATSEAEQLARRAFIQRTLELSLAGWPPDNLIRLPMPPLVSVTSVVYYDEYNASATMPNSDYIVVTDTEPGIVTLARDKVWPAPTLRTVAPIRVRYVAGYGAAAASVPDRYKALIRSLVAVRYENRDEMTPAAERQLANLRAALQMEWGW